MRISLNWKLAGIAAGVACGLLFLLLGWKAFLILVAFTALGFCLGAWADDGARIRKRVRAFVNRILGP